MARIRANPAEQLFQCLDAKGGDVIDLLATTQSIKEVAGADCGTTEQNSDS
jgi:hypothetical protein